MSISSYTTINKGTQYYFVNNLNAGCYSLSPVETNATSSASVRQCTACNSDGKYSTMPPYYQLGPAPLPVCPYYNYTLPNYPPVTVPTIDPMEYWYFAYEREGC